MRAVHQLQRQIKVSVIFGTRPEAIKLAPVILGLQNDNRFICNTCVTAQHREMLDQVLTVFDIVPDRDLHLMRPNQSLAELTGRAIPAIDKYLADQSPDLVIVQGDTTTVFCAALAAFYRRIPIGHVEAGLRTRDIYSPWPEEANRQLTSRLTKLHFAPTAGSRENLLREEVDENSIFVTGNTVIDALLMAVERVRNDPPAIPELPVDWRDRWSGSAVVLITGHRRENFGEGFESICRAIAELSAQFSDTQFIYPVHLNPNVREPVRRILQHRGLAASNVHLIEPVSYLPFVALMDRADLILTDSGGIQEEAPTLGKPVLVMRENTERPEAVEVGTAKLVGTSFDSIVREVGHLLTDETAYKDMASKHNPYGDGRATQRILDVCAASFFGD